MSNDKGGYLMIEPAAVPMPSPLSKSLAALAVKSE